MSVLGLDEIHKRIKKHSLIKNLGHRDLENPEGVGIDLRLGAVHKIVKGGAFIEADPAPSGAGQAGYGRRKGVETKLVAEFVENEKVQKEIVVKPGEYYLVQTVESVNTPLDLMPIVHVRTSLFRAGLLLLNSKTDPGYSGQLTMGLTNLSPFSVKLQLGARICNIIFHKIEGKTIKYRGQHQGGRVSPKKAERQV
ncbi:hypothetical protein A3J19_03070 [Candidatus Daviesbacteria bacterium RIFCSPLOWO2_02_FULL_41_8]|uniref:Uncharacterized protein n=3 Tax=Candidatus Daviesiibacteriota TaxID=1752718 RepID=A0A1F5NKF3_9BACT|nr:MAG: hypothetical protein A2871_00090 [Candidatus Daviesbacteria bacterium RIFCSPHIGHO2_01_FULL_41_23]OGE33301.1 MAG: hypothetical protein A3D83_03725 [Candidatus Daviesbacteria bacterium RIFCSPHIGHO2_02_FULL_41_10]OGE78023.1 MAG: hypothetical protein A3J19_03070 [Candidatus Daviesbacteria bacterium RIFCSPLOWO2_02_FULL_41_8]